MLLSNVRFVLLRPRYAGNLGGAARALKNFGLSDWAWVAPEAGDAAEGRRMAVHAEELLDAARVEASLADAISDCVWVVGTSSRKRDGRRRLDPRALATELAERTHTGRCAIVFGDERSGLTNDELDRCHAFAAIRADAAQPSLNLAQAVLLFAYELHEAALRERPAAEAPSARMADDATLQALESSLRGALSAAGFLNGPERHAVRDLVHPLRRARLTAKEAKLWRAACETFRKRAKRGE